MELSVQGHGFGVPKKLQTHIEKKVARLERYLPGIENLRVELSKQSSRRDAQKTVQLTVQRKKTLLRVEVSNGDLFNAFDTALDKMYKRIARYKGRRTDQRNNGITEDLELESAEELPSEALAAMAEYSEEEVPKVVRSKRFQIVPMSIEEAIEQMELLGHDFFVFTHEDDSKTKVLYRRKGKDYGLLQPEK